jgi:hypothetical protein
MRSGFIPTGRHEVVRTKVDATDSPRSITDAADQPPSFAPGPDRAIAVHIVRRLRRVIHNPVVHPTGT